MCPESVCRLCLATGAPVRAIADTPLQEVYEKLTNVLLKTSHKPVVACSVCHWQLRKCHKLMTRSVRADELLNKLLHDGAFIQQELMSMIDSTYKLSNTLVTSPTELNSYRDLDVRGRNIKDPLSCPNTEIIETEQVYVTNVTLESSEEGDIEGDVNKTLVDEENVHEARNNVDCIEQEILVNISRIKVEFTEDSDDEPLSAIASALKCQLLRTVHETRLDDHIRPRDTGGGEAPGSSITVHIERIKTEDELQNSENTSNESVKGKTKVAKNKVKRIKKNTITFNCTFCEEKFKCKRFLKNHVKKHTGNKVLQCGTCQRTFNHISNLYKHLRTHSGDKPFKCTVCQQRFSRKDGLAAHFRTHSGEKPFECTVCDKTFNQRSHLNGHLKTHSEDRPFECAICQRTFVTTEYLQRHLRTHTGERRYECTVCQRRFSRKDHLDTHLRTSSGKLFECSMCQQQFDSRCVLNVHSRTHADEQTFKCVVCQRKFVQKASLQRHLKRHSVERPFGCAICRSTFYLKRSLKRHLKTHTEEKPHECRVCQKSFNEQNHLSVHLKTQSHANTQDNLIKCT